MEIAARNWDNIYEAHLREGTERMLGVLRHYHARSPVKERPRRAGVFRQRLQRIRLSHLESPSFADACYWNIFRGHRSQGIPAGQSIRGVERFAAALRERRGAFAEWAASQDRFGAEYLLTFSVPGNGDPEVFGLEYAPPTWFGQARRAVTADNLTTERLLRHFSRLEALGDIIEGFGAHFPDALELQDTTKSVLELEYGRIHPAVGTKKPAGGNIPAATYLSDYTSPPNFRAHDAFARFLGFLWKERNGSPSPFLPKEEVMELQEIGLRLPKVGGHKRYTLDLVGKPRSVVYYSFYCFFLKHGGLSKDTLAQYLKTYFTNFDHLSSNELYDALRSKLPSRMMFGIEGYL